MNAASSESIRIGSSAPLKPKRTGNSFHLQPKRTGSSAPVQQKRTSTSAPLQSKRTGSSIPLQPKQTGGHVMGSVSLEPKSTCLIEKPARNNKTSHHSKATATRTPKVRSNVAFTRVAKQIIEMQAINVCHVVFHLSGLNVCKYKEVIIYIVCIFGCRVQMD